MEGMVGVSIELWVFEYLRFSICVCTDVRLPNIIKNIFFSYSDDTAAPYASYFGGSTRQASQAIPNEVCVCVFVQRS